MIFKVTFSSLNSIFIQTDTHSTEISLKVCGGILKIWGSFKGQHMMVRIQVVPQKSLSVSETCPTPSNLLEAAI